MDLCRSTIERLGGCRVLRLHVGKGRDAAELVTARPTLPCKHSKMPKANVDQTDFIVCEGWPNIDTTSAAQYQENTRDRLGSSTENGPLTTYEAFRQVYHANQGRSTPGSPQSTTTVEALSEECAELLRTYQRGLGTWMDIFDHSLHHQRQVIRYAFSSSLLLHSICAISAKQMSLIKDRFLWEPIASRHYGESLRLLIKELALQETGRDIILSATVLLSSYELLALPGTDHQRHLYGARTLIEALEIANNGSSLDHASFWIYARQDVALALVNERPTLIHSKDWPSIPQREVTEEDLLGRRILWLLARVIEVIFRQNDDDETDTQVHRIQELSLEIDFWWENLPSYARGIATEGVSDHGLTQIWFCDAAAGAGCLYYHLAKILFLERLLQNTSGSTSGASQHENRLESLTQHSLAIASISLSPDLADGAMVVAVNPLFYAAKYIKSLPLRAKIWALLENIEARLGFHTRNRVSQLQHDLANSR